MDLKVNFFQLAVLFKGTFHYTYEIANASWKINENGAIYTMYRPIANLNSCFFSLKNR